MCVVCLEGKRVKDVNISGESYCEYSPVSILQIPECFNPAPAVIVHILLKVKTHSLKSST